MRRTILPLLYVGNFQRLKRSRRDISPIIAVHKTASRFGASNPERPVLLGSRMDESSLLRSLAARAPARPRTSWRAMPPGCCEQPRPPVRPAKDGYVPDRITAGTRSRPTWHCGPAGSSPPTWAGH